MMTELPDAPQGDKEAAARFVQWAMISAALIMAGLAAFVFLDTFWPLAGAIGAAVVLQYLMFRKFKRPPDERR